MRTLIIFTLIFLAACGKEDYIGDALDAFHPNYYACTVMRVLEGDLFYCESTNQDVVKVELMGVKIESAKKNEAKVFTKSLLPIRTVVWVSIDESVPGEKGAISAFVLLNDKTFLNGYLVREGYAYESFEGRESEYKKEFDDLYQKEQFKAPEEEESNPGERENKAPWIK